MCVDASVFFWIIVRSYVKFRACVSVCLCLSVGLCWMVVCVCKCECFVVCV